MIDLAKYHLKYVIKSELGNVIALTATRWAAERMIEGIKAHDSPTSKMGSWSIEEIAGAEL